MMTGVYKLKKKLFLNLYDSEYDFREIRWWKNTFMEWDWEVVVLEHNQTDLKS
jgi:hypothetical protein